MNHSRRDFLVGAEYCGCRPWVWSDKGWNNKTGGT